MTKDEMVGWHHRLNTHEFEQILGDGEGWKPNVTHLMTVVPKTLWVHQEATCVCSMEAVS